MCVWTIGRGKIIRDSEYIKVLKYNKKKNKYNKIDNTISKKIDNIITLKPNRSLKVK